MNYIVVSEHHRWGQADSLFKALKNAGLYVETAADYFARDIQFSDDMKQAANEAMTNWLDYGREEIEYRDDEKTEIVIYKFDPEVWEDWEVSPIDGSVRFTVSDGDKRTQEQIDADFKACALPATWCYGVIEPR